jgi:hypothetical protein
MPSLLNPYVLLGALVVAIGIFFAGYTKGSNDKYTEWQLEIAAQAEASREKEKELQAKEDANTRRHQNEVRTIQSKLDDATKRLRNRPERLPDTSLANCKGSTGAELSKPDGEFLVGEAARADRIRQALETCYNHVDAN